MTREAVSVRPEGLVKEVMQAALTTPARPEQVAGRYRPLRGENRLDGALAAKLFDDEGARRPPTRGDVTLLGDAAHIMQPFTGRGVNYAMLDALELARNLTSDQFASVGAAFAAYDERMLERMADAIESTMASQDVMLAADAPLGLVAHVEEAIRAVRS